MMILANGKKAKLLEQERTYLNTLVLRLFTNNHVPADSDTVLDYNECVDTGYLMTFPVTPVNFAEAFLNAMNQGETDGDTFTAVFAHDGPDFTIYGYYFTDPADDDSLVIAERAAFPFTVTAPGLTFSVTPRKLMDTMH